MGNAHRTAAYKRDAANIVARANADPDARCRCPGDCGRTGCTPGVTCNRRLHEHPPHKTGWPLRWTAGHVNDSEVGGQLHLEASVCNYGRGGWDLVNRRRRQRHAHTADAGYRHW